MHQRGERVCGWNRNVLTAAVALGLAGAPALAQTTVNETEDNNSKTQADAVGAIALASGDRIVGTTTGASSAAGASSADYFRVRTTPQAPAIYRHQLALTSPTAGHAVSLRGLAQSGGAITAGGDAAFQTGVTTTTPARAVAWYGFGREEQVYYRVTGSGATTMPYTATLTTSVVSPVSAAGTLYAGPITLTQQNPGAFAMDGDMWLYDENMVAIAGAGNDDKLGLLSQLTRTLGPGTYTLAIGRNNLANNLASPADDNFRNGNVLDFADALADSIVNPTVANSGSISLAIGDGINPVVTVPLTFGAATIGDVQFVRFTVVPNPTSSGACCLSNGTCQALSQSACTASGGEFQGNGTACGSVECPAPGSCCGAGGCCTVTFETACAGGTWTAAGVCSPNTCAVPNDQCAGAAPVTVNTTVMSGNCNAASDDGADAGCQNLAGRGVWFVFTPASAGNYSVSTCGSNQDTVLTVYSGACGSLVELACDDDSCDGVNPPGSGSASVISALSLQAGTAYTIRVETFGSAPAGGPLVLRVESVAVGACCNDSTGACSLTGAGACGSGSTYQGNGTACSPNPCPNQPGACCVVGQCCTVTSQGACTGEFAGSGTTCTSDPCDPPANDTCTGAAAIQIGVPVNGSNCDATGAGDGPAASCQADGFRGVWYALTPTHHAAYRISTCESNQDTILTVFTHNACASLVQIACDDDTCTGPGSGLASDIASVVLNAGTPYLIRVQSFGAGGPPAGGAFTLSVTGVGALGACCSPSNDCTQTDAARCTGTFSAGVACGPTACVPPTGACCSGAACVTVTQAECTGPNTAFAGLGTVCNVFGVNNVSPCCLADYNHVGGVTVQDVFDFLNGYFTQSPQADVGGNGVTVQDIFEYLGLYFGRCD